MHLCSALLLQSTSRHPEFNVQFDILPSTRSSSNWSRSSGLPTKKPYVHFCSPPCVSRSRPYHHSWFGHQYNFWRGEERSAYNAFVRFAPVSCSQCRYEQAVFHLQSHSGIAVCEYAHPIPLYFIHEGRPEPARSADLVVSVF